MINTTYYPNNTSPSPNSTPYIYATNNTSAVSVDYSNTDIKAEDVILRGKSLYETLKKIEDRLNIIYLNPELENRWAELKAIGKKYKEKEDELLLKENTWRILKK